MNDKKRKPAVVSAPERTLTQDQLDEIHFPELSKDQFTIAGKNFRVRALVWKWERVFRKAVIPIVESEFKPFERAIYMFASELAIVKEDLGFTSSFTESEIDVDMHLTNCVSIICLSQDPEILQMAAEGQEVPLELQMKLEKKYIIMIENADDFPGGSARNYLREIVRKQCEKMNLVQILGESLIARFGELSALAGTKSQFDSLKQGFTQQARKFIEKAGRVAGIQANLSSQSTETGLVTNSPETPPKTLETKVEETQAVAASE